MKILVDADSCPVAIREVLCRAAKRTKCKVIFISNSFINLPKSAFIQFFQVQKGFDVADNEIIKQANNGDLIITSDILLADAVINSETTVLTHRGDFITKDNIKSILSMRNFMEELRSSGIDTGGHSKFSQAEIAKFSNKLDSILYKILNSKID